MSEHEIAPKQRAVPEATQETPASSHMLPRATDLQRAIGNRNVQKLLRNLRAQPKLQVSRPDEPAEKEADRTADRVVSRTPVAASGDADDESRSAKKEDELVQRIESSRSTGDRLPPATESEMGSKFGADFSGVRIHSDTNAASLSKDLGARAFATGPDVFFGKNEFRPDSPDGKHLLAHELTHTIQQGASAPLKRSLSGVLNGPVAPGKVHAAPIVTAVVAPAEIGAGKSVTATATLAGAGRVGWTLIGAPPGVTINPSTGKITATAASNVSGGTNFKAEAKLKGTPGDSAQSNNILLVGITGVVFTAAPAFANQPIFGGGAVVFPANTADPNRDGYGGNTAQAVATTLPAGRAATFSLAGGGAAAGATAEVNIITPGSATGFIKVKAKETATGSEFIDQLTVNPVPTKLTKLVQVATFAPAAYGAQNQITFKSSDTTGNVLNRAVGETITVQRDDFGLGPRVNPGSGGPNPGPIGPLSAPANGWNDSLFTPLSAAGARALPGVVAGQDPLDVNNYIGPGAPSALPRVWVLRQGFSHRSWSGQDSNEFDQGTHRRSLVKTGAAIFFRTEHIFPGANAKVQNDPYAGPPQINYAVPVVAPKVPAAAGIAADGVATAQATTVTAVVGRNVNWLAEGPIAFTAPALGAAAPAAGVAIIQSGLKAGSFPITVHDSIFPNRQAKGTVKLVAVTLGGIRAVPATVPAGTLVAVVNVNAQPGGRVLLAQVNPAAAAAGVTAVPVAAAGAAAALPARAVTVTRPAAFRGTVTVTVSDSIRRGTTASVRVRFL